MSKKTAAPPPRAPWIRPIVVGLFFCSGASGLIYEVAWTKSFSLVTGGTTRSLTAVLVAYMAGLGLGGFAGGRLADRWIKRPVLAYGLIEGLIGLFAVAVTWLIPALIPVLKVGKAAVGGSGLGFDFLRFGLAAATMLVPTTLMGATFPILLKGVLAEREKFGTAAGTLYAANTLGAMVGSLLSGFWLIATLGLRGTVLSAAGLNLLILVVVALLPRLRRATAPVAAKAPGAPAAKAPGAKVEVAVAGRLPRLGWLILVGYGASGLAAMVYQVAWARALSLSLGSTTYALGLIFAAFIGGLAVGGAAVTPWADRIRRPLLLAAGLELAIGLSALLVTPMFEWMTARMFGWSPAFSNDFATAQVARFLSAFVLILAPTMAMGALFPVILKAFSRLRSGVGEPAGVVYAANTVGAILGSFLAAHVLIRWFGLQRAIQVATVVSAAIGVGWLLASEAPRWARQWLAPGLGLLVVAGILAVPKWDPNLMNSGPSLYSNTFAQELAKGEDIRRLLNNYGEVLFYREGVETTVSVVKTRSTGELFLRLNGKTDASSTGDMPSQVLCAHLPLLLHPDPKRVMILGMASGVTAGSALKHPLERLDVVEIAPEVVEAAWYFQPANGLDLDHPDPRMTIIEDDARNYLALSDVKYDVIILEPTNPLVAGVSALFTLDFYRLVSAHLAPGGLAIAFLPAYDMNVASMEMMFRTFGQAFGAVTLWEAIPRADYFVIAGPQPPAIDPERLRQRGAQPDLAADLARVAVAHPEDLLGRFVMGEETMARIGGQGPVHTDDRRQLEYLVPKLYGSSRAERLIQIAQTILAQHEPPFALIQNLTPADRELLTAFENARTSFYQNWIAGERPGLTQQDADIIIDRWQNLIATHPGRFPSEFAAQALTQLLIARAQARLAQNNLAAATADLELAFNTDPTAILPGVELARILIESGQPEPAEPWVRAVHQRSPDEPYACYILGLIALHQGDLASAEPLFRVAVKNSPNEPEFKIKLASSLAMQRKFQDAEAVLQTLIDQEPNLAEAYFMIAQVLNDEGRPLEAEKFRDHAIKLDPTSPLANPPQTPPR